MNSSIKKSPYSFLYENSLSLVFLLLTVITIIAQVLTGIDQYNLFLNEHHKDSVSILQYLTSDHFIEGKGSPQSKPVDAPISETGE